MGDSKFSLCSPICAQDRQSAKGQTMCGRAKLETDVSEIKIKFRIPVQYPTPNFPPSWNVAPTDNLPIIRYDAKAGSRTLDLMRWVSSRIGPRTSRRSTRWLRPWIRNQSSAKHSSVADASSRSTICTSGRRSNRGRSSPARPTDH